MTPHGLDIDRPFVDGACSLRIQRVLFDTELSEIERRGGFDLAGSYERKDIVRRLLDRFEKSGLNYLK